MKTQSFIICLLLIILSVEANTIDRQYCLKEAPEFISCQWYLECLERLFECGDRGYPIGYGYKYCSRFKDANFPDQTASWVNKTMICLKKSLVPIMESKLSGKYITCAELKHEAFQSHPICYTQSGFCTLLKNKSLKDAIQIIRAFWKIFDLQSVIGFDADKQIYEVFKICLTK